MLPWDMHEERLAGEDSGWLHMDRRSNPMVITGLLELDGVLEQAQLRALVEDRLLRIERFRQCVVEPALGTGAPSWQRDPAFAVERHLQHHQLTTTDDVELRDAIDRVVSMQLDRGKPLWEIHTLDRPGAGTVVLARVHHAIGDGFALLGVLLAICDDAPAPAEPAERTRTGVGSVVRAVVGHVGKRLAHPQAVLGDAAAAARWLRSFARLVLLPPDHRSVLRGRLGPHKRVAWTRAFALTAIKAAGRRDAATINDVVMAGLAGGLRRHLLRRGAERVRDVRAMIPFNLRPPDQPVRMGNRFGLVVLSLPLSVDSARARLREVKRRMDALKHSAEAQVGMAIVATMGLAPRGLESLGVAFFTTKASAVLTNVPGPREPLRLGGRTIRRILYWVPQSGDLALGLSIFSYAGAVSVGVMADARRLPDPAQLVTDIEAELAALLE